MKIKKKLKMNLQLFAEPDGDNGQGDNTDPIDDKNKGGEPNPDGDLKTFTQEELNDIVKDRLAREKAKQEQQLREAIAKEQEEAKRLAELTAEERAKELAKKNEEELAALREEIRVRDLEADTVERLEEEGLPVKFKSFLIGKDAENTNENIKAFKEVFDAAIKEAVEEKLKGNTPKHSGHGAIGTQNPWSKEHLNLTEQGRILRENPELAKELMNRRN